MPRFTDVGMATGIDGMEDARGAAIADYDNDGDLDVLVNRSSGDLGADPMNDSVAPGLFRNNVGARSNWLAVELVGDPSRPGTSGRRSSTDAVGARIIATVRDASGTPRDVLRVVNCGSGYASQHGMRQHFGLGDATRAERLEIHWPSGHREVHEDVKARGVLRIREGHVPDWRELVSTRPKGP